MRNTITSSIRQGIRNAIQSVLGSLQPLFDLPAMKTLVPTTGTIPTFTRDTTKTGTNYDGQVFAGLANEPIFEGARRVENLITASEDMTNAAYGAFNGAHTVTATTVAFDGTLNGILAQTATITDDGSGAGGRTFTWSVDVKLITGAVSSNAAINMFLSGDAIATTSVDIGDAISTTSQRFCVTASTDAAGTGVQAQFRCDDAVTLEITNWQLEETTANSNPSMPSEYVSTGVGTGSELLTNGTFDTDTDWTDYLGATVGGTVGITGGELVTTQGSNSVWMGAYQTIPTVAGRQYVIGLDHTSQSAPGNFRFGANNGLDTPSQTPNLGYATIGVVGSHTQMFTATSENTTIVIVNGAAATVSQTFDNLSVKEVSHGANVDGVEYFLQTNPHTVNGGVVTSDELHWLELDGTAGNYASTPDTPENSVTGSMTLEVDADHSWSSNDSLVGKWDGPTNQRSWFFDLASTKLRLNISSNGVSYGSPLSPTLPFSSGRHTVKAEFDAVAETVTYYADGVQLGSAVAAGRSSIFNGSSDVLIGAINTGTGGMVDGKIYSAKVYDGIGNDAVLVADFAPQTAIADGWTIHSTSDTQLKTNKAMTFTEKRTGPIALSTALAVDNGFNASTSLHGSVAAFPNLIPPAARVDFTEWTQTGTGSITPVGDGVNLFADDFNSDIDDWLSHNSAILTNPSGRIGVESDGVSQGNAKIDFAGVTEGEWYVIKADLKVHRGGANHSILEIREASSPATTVATSGSIAAAQDGVSVLFQAPGGAGIQLRFRNATASGSLVAEWDNVSIQKYSHTTLSDEDDTASEVLFDIDTTVPNDSEWYQADVTMSAGTALKSGVVFNIAGTNTNAEWSWSDPATFTTLGASMSTSTVTANADGTHTFHFRKANNTSGDTGLKIGIYPASNDATTQGTVNVHGDVDLKRVSVAAEPTWNTLRPGDSVEQHVLQQNDPDTTWTSNNSPTLVSDLPDPTGGTNAFSVQDANASANASISQTNIDLGATTSDKVVYEVWIKKTSGGADFPAIEVTDVDDSSSFVQAIIDTDNGLIIGRTGFVPDEMKITDGAILAQLMPNMYPDGADWWHVGTKNQAVSADNYKPYLYGAFADTFDGGNDVSAVGTATFFAPTMTLNESFFFDSIATTGTVTEVVQDWSKIFSYSTEADDNVANIVFDHNYLGGAGVNIEGASSNIITASQDISASPSGYYITGANITITPGFTDPAGTSTAVRLTATSSGIAADNYIRRFSVATTYTKGTFSVWVRRITGTGVISLQGPNGVYGAKDVESEISGAWTRVDVSTTSGGGYLYFGIGVETSGDVIEVAFFQVEPETDFPSSYIPTDGSSVTRNADLLTYSAVGVADTFPMTINLDITPSASLANVSAISVDDGSSDRAFMYQAGGTDWTGYITAGGVPQAQIINGAVTPLGVSASLTLAASLNDTNFYFNGSPGTVDTACTMPATPTTIRIGARYDNAMQPYANIRNVKIFDKRLTDAEVSKL